MKGVLERRRVVAPDKGVYVELDGHARIAELANPVERLKATRQTDLEDVLTEEPTLEMT